MFGEHKASMVERFNRTLKTIMWKRLTEDQSRRWIDILESLLLDYNTTKHGTIRMTPIQASTKSKEAKLWVYLYGDQGTENGELGATKIYQLGDWVRVSKTKRTFEKGYTPNWSHEIFRIIEIAYTNPTQYYLQDHKGEQIQGSFYEQELSNTELSDTSLVDQVKGSKTVRGKKTT